MSRPPFMKALSRVFLRPSKENGKLLIFAAIAALFIWFYIAVTVYPSYSVQIYNVPVVVDVKDSAAAGYGLSVLSPQSESLTVNVEISGARTAIGGLTKDDIIAYVDFDTNVTDTVGTQKRPIRVKTKNGTILTNCTLSTDSIDVKMDRYQSSSFPVSEVLYPDVTVSDETVVVDRDAILCDPSSVTIYGPTSALSRIHHVRVTVTDAVKLYETRSFTNCKEYDLIDADGNIITDAAFQVQATSFVVKIPVFYTHTLPVTINLSGVPAGFDETLVLQRLRLNTDRAYMLPGFGDDLLSIVIETDSADEKAALSKLESWSLGTIPLSSLNLGGTPIEVPVVLPTEYTDRSNLQTVYVTMDESNLVAGTRWINTANIDIMNGTPSYDYDIQKGRFQITLIGTAEEIASITTDDITATVNLYNAVVSEEGTFSHAVTFTLPKQSKGVWVSGITKVNITATLSEESP
ncbi:MAG: hypothetical protein IKM30_06665 [Oscillospiraceae bacterium]|nr:hypothetical protein [Oscillospiraceae bacterium]